MGEDLAGLILDSVIYRGSLFSDWKGKMGFVGARPEDLKCWNLVQGHIFLMREDLAGLIWIMPSAGVVCLVAKTGKRELTEPGAM